MQIDYLNNPKIKIGIGHKHEATNLETLKTT